MPNFIINKTKKKIKINSQFISLKTIFNVYSVLFEKYGIIKKLKIKEIHQYFNYSEKTIRQIISILLISKILILIDYNKKKPYFYSFNKEFSNVEKGMKKIEQFFFS